MWLRNLSPLELVILPYLRSLKMVAIKEDPPIRWRLKIKPPIDRKYINWDKDTLFYCVTTFSFTSCVLGPIYWVLSTRDNPWNLTSANPRSARPGYLFDKMADGRKEIKIALNIFFILFSDCSVVDGSWYFYGTTFESENQSGNVNSPSRIETERICLSSQTKTEYTWEGHAHIENFVKK